MLALEILSLVLPIALYALLLRRLARGSGGLLSSPPRTLLVLASVACGAAAFVPGWLVEGWIEGWAQLDEHARGRTNDIVGLLYALLVAAPLEQGLKVLAIVPAWRSPRFASEADGLLYGSAVGLGFVTAHDVQLFAELAHQGGVTGLDTFRALLAAPAHVFFAASWGFVLGREVGQEGVRRIGGRLFDATWFFAMLFNGVYDHIVFARGRGALIATAPILAAMGIITYFTLRGLRPGGGQTRRSRFSLAPPTIAAMRAALWRTEQPVMVGWIGIGALVTIGVITSALAGAVAIGHRIGLDFTAVDRADTSASFAPLVLLGGAALLAFPVAGYLISKASASRGVLEAAIAAALAIAGGLVMLGLAAPVAVVFAIAFAPIALGLACAGAWIGVTR